MLRVTTPTRIHTKGSGSGLGHGIYAEGNDSYQNTYKRFREWLGARYIMLRVTTPTRIHTKRFREWLGTWYICCGLQLPPGYIQKVQGVTWDTVYYAEGNDSYQDTYKRFRE